MPVLVGQECRLSLIFIGRDGADFSFRVIYGEDSEGPPQELGPILINAVKLTEDWYRQQLKENEHIPKKWWQVRK